MADYKISELASGTITEKTLLEASIPDGLGGYDSRSVEAGSIHGALVADLDDTATITASDLLAFSDVSDSNKPKSTTAAAVANLADINKGTRTFVGILGKQVNSYYRLGFNLPQAKAETITLNSVIKTGDPTELKNLFTLVNYSSNGYFQLYSNSSSLVEGAYYEVNVTIS